MNATAEAVVAEPVLAAKPSDPLARLKKEWAELEQNAKAAAKKRLAGSKVEQLIEKLPSQIEDEVDALLDRVGLVRKARVGGAKDDADLVVAADGVVVVEAAAVVVEAEAEAPKKAKKSKA